MSWEEVLAGLELRFAAERAAALAGEVDERRAAELAGLSLADRLRPLVGTSTTVTVAPAGHDPVTGSVTALGVEWLLLAVAPAGEVLIALAHVTWVDGLSAHSEVAPPSRARLALDLRHALAGLGRDRSGVQVLLAGGTSRHGTIDAVGADHLLLALHHPGEPRRASAVTGVRAVALGAVVAVRRGA